MNLNMSRLKNETKDLILSKIRKCEPLNNQTHRKTEEILEFKLAKSREMFSFKPPILLEGSWMIGLTTLEVYNSIFIITEKNNEFELFTDGFDEFSFEELKDKVEGILKIPNISHEHYNMK